MDQRKQMVLRAIIKEYIGTVDPVGSKNLAGKYGLDVSSATIRNEMSSLEKMGYIEQPHTSAGRIPSELGYRYYVDYLMEKYRLALQEEQAIREELDPRVQELDQLLKRAGRILSELSDYPALVSEPQFQTRHYKYIRLIEIDERTALLVVALDDGEIRNYQVNLAGRLSEEEYCRITNILNESLRGNVVSQLSGDLLDRRAFESVQNRVMMDDILQALGGAAVGAGIRTIHVAGTLNIFNQPEFKDVDRIRDFLGFLEEQQKLQSLIAEGGEGITIKIGEEIPVDRLEGVSVITSTYCVNGRPVGTIGVIGPTRMDYSKSATLLERVAQGLSLSLLKLMS